MTRPKTTNSARQGLPGLSLMRVFWSNGLVGTITTLALILLFWPLIGRLFSLFGKTRTPAAT